MRTDKSVDRVSFRQSNQWKTDQFENIRSPDIDRRLKGAEEIDGRLFVHSLSGKERNHLFVNLAGEKFDDVSLISGLDNIADSRGFATLDYDRDGMQDIALVNANTPLLNLYRNNLGDSKLSNPQNFIAIRFVGGNKTDSAQPKTACRDGFGAMVEISLASGPIIKREHRCGEGYGAQNSATMIVGIGDAKEAKTLKVRWPSGKSYSIDNVPAKALVTAFELQDDAGNESNFSVSSYEAIELTESIATKSNIAKFTIESSGNESAEPSNAQLRVFITMATWCPSCLKHLPDLDVLGESFGSDELEFIGLPIDPTDTEQKLRDYADKHKPAYRILHQLSDKDRESISNAMSNVTPFDALPATFVTTADGKLVWSQAGIPTVSRLRKLLIEP